MIKLSLVAIFACLFVLASGQALLPQAGDEVVMYYFYTIQWDPFDSLFDGAATMTISAIEGESSFVVAEEFPLDVNLPYLEWLVYGVAEGPVTLRFDLDNGEFFTSAEFNVVAISNAECTVDGDACDESTECCSELCSEGFCGFYSECIVPGGLCRSDFPCCIGECSETFFTCGDPECVRFGGACDEDTDVCCANDSAPVACFNGICGGGLECAGAGEECDNELLTCCEGDCIEGFCSFDLECALPEQSCESIDCCFGDCIEGFCSFELECAGFGEECDGELLNCCEGDCIEGFCFFGFECAEPGDSCESIDCCFSECIEGFCSFRLGCAGFGEECDGELLNCCEGDCIEGFCSFELECAEPGDFCEGIGCCFGPCGDSGVCDIPT